MNALIQLLKIVEKLKQANDSSKKQSELYDFINAIVKAEQE